MIGLHPTSENAIRYRVQDRILGCQYYFGFKRYGSKENAYKHALECQKKLKNRRAIRKKRLELDFNKMFDQDGLVKGIFVGERYNAPLLIIRFTYNGQQRKNTRRLENKSLWEAYQELTHWAMKCKDVDPTPEINIQIKRSFKLFRELNKHLL